MPATPTSAPKANYRPPAGACDCHAHVFGPAERYPFSPKRSYTPDEAPLSDYLALLDSLGIERGVIVQPSIYGTDNRCTVDTSASLPERLRAIAAVDAEVEDAELDRLNEGGVCGVRINIIAGGGVGLDAIEPVAAKIARLGWHIQLMVDEAAKITQLKSRLRRLPVPVVVDHFGLSQVSDGIEAAAFHDLLDLVRDGRTWVKISHAYGVTAEGAPYGDVAPLVHALLDADPTRLLWGTDWPHPSERTPPFPDDAVLLDAFAGWVEDEAHRRQILVDNPKTLYRFD